LFFERLAKSRDKNKMHALATRGRVDATAADVIKDPFVLEFLGLEERGSNRARGASADAAKAMTAPPASSAQ